VLCPCGAPVPLLPPSACLADATARHRSLHPADEFGPAWPPAPRVAPAAGRGIAPLARPARPTGAGLEPPFGQAYPIPLPPSTVPRLLFAAVLSTRAATPHARASVSGGPRAGGLPRGSAHPPAGANPLLGAWLESVPCRSWGREVRRGVGSTRPLGPARRAALADCTVFTLTVKTGGTRRAGGGPTGPQAAAHMHPVGTIESARGSARSPGEGSGPTAGWRAGPVRAPAGRTRGWGHSVACKARPFRRPRAFPCAHQPRGKVSQALHSALGGRVAAGRRGRNPSLLRAALP
jgi:hypothetical protein